MTSILYIMSNKESIFFTIQFVFSFCNRHFARSRIDYGRIDIRFRYCVSVCISDIAWVTGRYVT